jgi:hypothetical protein
VWRVDAVDETRGYRRDRATDIRPGFSGTDLGIAISGGYATVGRSDHETDLDLRRFASFRLDGRRGHLLALRERVRRSPDGPQPHGGELRTRTATGIGDTAAEIVGALSRRPGLASTAAGDVTVAGFPGRQIDFAIAPGWKESCDWWGDPTSPVVPLVGTFDDNNFWVYNAVTKGEQYRYVVLDTPDGGNAVIAITAVDPERLQDVLVPAMNIVHGLQYHIRD